MNVQEISLNKIKLGQNSRMRVSNEDLSGLMESIKEQGLLEPIGLVKKGRTYEIAYGNRRFMAVSRLGIAKIPAVVMDKKSAKDIDLMNLAENVQRSNVSPLEVGRYIQRLTKTHGMTAEEIRVRLGVPMSYIRACVTAMREVPKEYQSKILNKPATGKGGEIRGIPLSTVPSLVAAAKTNRLNLSQRKTLFKVADNPKFKTANANKIAAAIAAGSKDPLKDVNNVRNVQVKYLISEKEYERLEKQHVKDGPFKSVADVIRAVTARKLSTRIKFL